jgi:hypothetical protein
MLVLGKKQNHPYLENREFKPGVTAYFFLCLFFLKRFLRLWVAILCLLRFLPLGILLLF